MSDAEKIALADGTHTVGAEVMGRPLQPTGPPTPGKAKNIQVSPAVLDAARMPDEELLRFVALDLQHAVPD